MSGLRHRRDFLKATAKTVALGATVPYWFSGQAALTQGYQAKNDRPLVGCVGCGSRGETVRGTASKFGDVVAICDPHLDRAEQAAQEIKDRTGKDAQVYQDYRKMLERKDLDIVVSATPEHWHAQVMVDACRSGRDVFTEKPLCMTVQEAQIMRKVVEQTGRVVQVGSQQRSREEFALAVEFVHAGRIGKLKQVYAVVPFRNTQGGPFETKPVPPRLDWDLWQGPAAAHPFLAERFEKFRWWQEYSGGILTDWGQHQMDVAFWGMRMDESGPLSAEGKAIFPNPQGEAYFNNPDRFLAKLRFPGDLELYFFSARDEQYEAVLGKAKEVPDLTGEAGIAPGDTKRNGVMFLGEKGKIFVNRGGVSGVGAEEAKQRKTGVDGNEMHMKNFFDCVKSRQEPICPVRTAARVITACLLANMAIRTDHKLTWDVAKEEFVGDAEASNSPYLHREDRAPYQLQA